MQYLKKKMKFLAVKLSALKSELKVSKEILESASSEVERMFKERYFPEQPANPPEENQQDTDLTQNQQEEKEEKEKISCLLLFLWPFNQLPNREQTYL